MEQLRFASRYSQPSSTRTIAQAVGSVAQAEQNPSHSGGTASSTIPGNNPYVKDPNVEAEKQRQHALKRIRWASTGLFFSVLGLGICSYLLVDALDAEEKKRSGIQLDAPGDANTTFQGRDVHVIGAGEDKRIVAEGAEETDLVETGTSSVPYFPKVLYLPNTSAGGAATPNTPTNPGNVRNDEEYTLVGLGIRTVSFLGIQVYVLGLYVRTADLTGLQASLIRYINDKASTLVPSEKDELQAALLDPIKSAEIWEGLLRQSNVRSAWRISPTRSTDFAHLRDGWITGINKGTQAAKAKAAASGTGPVDTEYESESFGQAVKSFREMFAKGGRAPKGSVMTLVMDQEGGLNVYFEDTTKKLPQERIGSVVDPRVAKLIWMGYLAGKNVSSEAARKGVANGCLMLASRPVGSAETRVA